MSTEASTKEDALARIARESFAHAVRSPAGAPPTKTVEIPEAIRKSSPKLTLEMSGPLGTAVRRLEQEKVFSKDYARAKTAQAKNFADKQKGNLLASKEQTQGLLKSEFSKAASKGRLAAAFTKAKSRGR